MRRTWKETREDHFQEMQSGGIAYPSLRVALVAFVLETRLTPEEYITLGETIEELVRSREAHAALPEKEAPASHYAAERPDQK